MFELGTLQYGGHRLHGHTSCAYGTDGRRYALNAGTEGTLPFRTQIAWCLRCSYLNSGDRSCPKYLLNNTGTRNMGCQTEWGYRRKGLMQAIALLFTVSLRLVYYINVPIFLLCLILLYGCSVMIDSYLFMALCFSL